VLGDPAIVICKGAGYLAYIVTTKIKHDSKSIDTNFIGLKKSEPARKELEIKYGLVKAEDQQASLKRMMPLDASKVTYGKQVTKRAISNVLNEVLDKYKYTSLAEFNAILSLYNVVAEQGSETSRTFKNGGLVYRVTDKEGNRVSAPIKASAFFLKPTLKNLEGRYLKNDLARQQYKSKLKSAIDFTLKSNSTVSLKDLSDALFKRQIRMVERRNKDGFLYGLTFIDLKNKVVFNGSDLAKDLSAAALQQRFPERLMEYELHSRTRKAAQEDEKVNPSANHAQIGVPATAGSFQSNDTEQSMIEQLMRAEYSSNYLPYELRKNPKKKKRRKSNHL
jgi:hypothetical protein